MWKQQREDLANLRGTAGYSIISTRKPTYITWKAKAMAAKNNSVANNQPGLLQTNQIPQIISFIKDNCSSSNRYPAKTINTDTRLYKLEQLTESLFRLIGTGGKGRVKRNEWVPYALSLASSAYWGVHTLQALAQIRAPREEQWVTANRHFRSVRKNFFHGQAENGHWYSTKRGIQSAKTANETSS